jgi:hypothetical protein
MALTGNLNANFVETDAGYIGCPPLDHLRLTFSHLRQPSILCPPLAATIYPQPGNVSLQEHDPEMYDLIEREKSRQWRSLELIASEVSGDSAEARPGAGVTSSFLCALIFESICHY